MESSPASDQTLHCLVMSLNMTLSVMCGAIEMGTGSFCYSFDNRFILSFLGNHYSLTFQFCFFFH